MRYDILLLEDNLDVHELLLDILRDHFQLGVIDFFSGVEALRYLRMPNASLPLAYLCDMRIVGTGNDPEQELRSPLEIFDFAYKRGNIDLFRFCTGHVSEHDRRVFQRTGAAYFLKPFDIHTLDSFVELILEKKRALGWS